MGPGFESLKVHHRVGVTNAKGTPVPIPNTEVKLCSAENTWSETTREDRSTLTYLYSSLAQLAERMTVNHDVAGSSPAGGARKKDFTKVKSFFQ